MRILLVTHYFPPEIGAPQARLSAFAAHWASAGDKVTVLTGMPNHPTGIIPPAYKGKRSLQEKVDEYRVIRTWVYATPNEGIVKKTLGHLSFMISSVVLGWGKTGPADVVVVSSPTFFSILSALVLAKFKRAKFVVEVRDLWPAIFVELGVLTNPFLIRVLERLEMAAYKAADLVVVVSEGFRSELLKRGVPAEKVRTIRNGADIALFPLGAQPEQSVRESLGATPNETLVLYIGAHGISHGLSTVAEAAHLLNGRPIHFAFVGEGAEKARLKEQVEKLELTNVTMRDGIPRTKVPAVLAAADVCLVMLKDIPLFKTFIPSKIFEYLTAEKAVIGAVRGESAEILNDAGAKVIEPGDANALAAAIEELAKNPELRLQMGETGRIFVHKHFDRKQLATEYRDFLVELTR